MKLSPASVQYIADIQARYSEQKEFTQGEQHTYTRQAAMGASEVLRRVLTELPEVLAKIEAQAFFGEEYQDFFGQDAA